MLSALRCNSRRKCCQRCDAFPEKETVVSSALLLQRALAGGYSTNADQEMLNAPSSAASSSDSHAPMAKEGTAKEKKDKAEEAKKVKKKLEDAITAESATTVVQT